MSLDRDDNHYEEYKEMDFFERKRRRELREHGRFAFSEPDEPGDDESSVASEEQPGKGGRHVE